MAGNAENSLVSVRPAVAIVLLWAHCAWAQLLEQPPGPVQGIGIDLGDQPGRYSGAVTPADIAGTGQGAGQVPQPERSKPLSLRLATGVGYDDNVFRTGQDEQSDYFVDLRPAISLNGWAGKHHLGLGYAGDYRKYGEYGTEDFYDHRVYADANLDLTRKADLNLGGQLWWGHDPRGSPGARIINPGDLDTWREQSVKAEFVYGRAISRAQIIPWVEFSGVRYLNNDQSDRDFDRQDYRARGTWRFSPRFYVVAEGGYADIDHLDPSNGLDRTETDLLGGVGWEVTAKTSGEILVGVLNRDFDDPARGNNRNFDWDARIYWTPKPYSKVTAYTRRTSVEDASGGVGTFLADTLGVLWTHAFSEWWRLNAAFDYTIADYDSPRTDKYVDFDIGVSRTLTSWLDLNVTYGYLNRRSNVPGLDYDDNMLLVELRAGIDRDF